MYGKMKDNLQTELAGIKDAGLFKEERLITSPQAADINQPRARRGNGDESRVESKGHRTLA